MKYKIMIAVLAALIVGCATQPETGASQPSATSENPAKTTVPVVSAQLGSQAEADHFTVTLDTERDEVTEGNNKFVAQVWHHGDVSEDGKVTLALSMPDHGMDGPTVELKHVGGGKYEGEAELSMGGEWLANLTIQGAEGHNGTAAYKLVAMQK